MTATLVTRADGRRAVLQPDATERLGSHGQAHQERHAAGQAERLLLAHQLPYELLLRAGRGPVHVLARDGLLVRVRRDREPVLCLPVLLQQAAHVLQRHAGRVGCSHRGVVPQAVPRYRV